MTSKMKKTMKTMLAFVAGALALSACGNEDILNESENKGGAKLVTLTAYQEGEGGTRAAIDATDSKKIDWTSDDQINYFGGGTNESMTLKTGAGTTSATFEGTVTPGSTDYVLYPYQSTATNNAGVITAEVPMTQYAVANSFDPKAALMVGQVNAGSVEFKNVMSYVKVTIPEGITNCKQVVLKAKDAWTTVAGKVKINATDASWAETDAKEGQAFVRLVPTSSATTLEAGKSYYIAILPQTMATGFELIFNDNDVIKVKQASSSVEFGRSKTKKLGAITSFTYTVSTVDLTAPDDASYTTLKMADRNIGAATTDAYGDYFAWGALRPAYLTKAMSEDDELTNLYWSGGFNWSNTPFYTGDGDSNHSWSKYNSTDNKTRLDATDDIASMLWGGNWRMATRMEWLKNTSNSSVKGLPLAGSCFDLYFDNVASPSGYWSSTPFGDDYAHYLNTNGTTAYVVNDNRNNGFPVRPVLAQ